MGPACPAQAARELLEETGATQETGDKGLPCLRLLRDASVCVEQKYSFRLLYFLTSVEKRERKKRVTPTHCGIPSFCLEKKVQKGVRKPEKMSKVF